MMISSRHNERVKAACRLWKRGEREEQGLTLVEGYRQLQRALEAAVPVRELFFCRALWLGANEEALIERARAAGAQMFETTPEVFAKLSVRDRPDGLVGIAAPVRLSLPELWDARDRSQAPLYLVCEGIEKPGNLGAILRSADGAGASGVLVTDRVTDISNPNVVRSSVGTLFALPVVEAESAATREWLLEHGIAIVAASPAADSLYTDADLRAPVAIVLGSEQYGLKPEWSQAPGAATIRIPMLGAADSLNVAQAATLLLYEARRQRSS